MDRRFVAYNLGLMKLSLDTYLLKTLLSDALSSWGYTTRAFQTTVSNYIGPNFIELQRIVLTMFLLSENKQNTRHKLYM